MTISLLLFNSHVGHYNQIPQSLSLVPVKKKGNYISRDNNMVIVSIDWSLAMQWR